MQFRLVTLFIVIAAPAVFCGIITAPPFIAVLLLCGIAWILPAFWITGVIYASGRFSSVRG